MRGLRRLAAGTVMLAACLGGPAMMLAGCRSQPELPLVTIVQTSRDLSQRLTALAGRRFGTKLPAGVPVLHVDDTIRYQRVEGVGAAMTDTSAWLLHDELSAGTRAAVMNRLFGNGGIRLGFIRVPIGAADFTRNRTPYSYDDLSPGQSDPTLRRFSINHDEKYIIPILRQMLRINPRVEILASPWSPPAWMKSNDSLGNHADRGRLLASAYGPLARYFVRFINAYARRGVRIDAVSAQNEPGQGANYPGLNLPERAEALFISRYLAPTLAAADLHPRIYAHDYKWLFWHRAAALVSQPTVARAIAGIAWHCYDGNPNVMSALHRAQPGLDQIESECSSPVAPGSPAELMIASFRNWASGALLWNLALDPSGGPVEPPNNGCPRCTGVVTVDGRAHSVSYGSDYYELGQFSAFVQPGARRIASNNFVAYNSHTKHHRVNYATAAIDDVAFENPGGTDVLLAHNNAGAARRFVIDWRRRTLPYTLSGGATVTFTWKR
jgi:glucosylceramidase